MGKKVFVSGCYDMLHSGHVAFFKEASAYGDLYVGIGSDQTIEGLKGRKPVYSENERLYMVKAIRYVKDAYINSGSGMMDFVDSVEKVKPDIFVVNEDGDSEIKRTFCQERGIEYVVLKRVPEDGLVARSTTAIRTTVKSQLPYRLDLAGTWIDQPYVSKYCPGAGCRHRQGMRQRKYGLTTCRITIARCWPSCCSALRTSRTRKTMCPERRMPSGFACRDYAAISTTTIIGRKRLRRVTTRVF